MKLFVLILISSALTVHARIFNMNEGNFAGYLAGTYGPSSVKTSYFEGESSSTAFSKGYKTNMGGEFGFLYRTTSVSWIFGFELIKPTKISGQATTGSNVDYKYSSDISVFAPKLGLELILYQTQKYRWMLNGTVGTASLTSKTDYTALTIAPNTDFSTEAKGSAQLMTIGTGIEVHMADNTTFFAQAQYRDLKFRKIKYAEDATGAFQGGTPSSGTTITHLDGTKRKLNLTGAYASVGFRFWLF